MPIENDKMTAYLRFDTATRVLHSTRLTEKNARDTWVVQGGLSYYIGHRVDESWVHIRQGYRVNGAVVHRILVPWLAPNQPGGQAAIVHNYLCNIGIVRSKGHKRRVSRFEANAIFLQAMKVCRINPIKRTILYWSAQRLARIGAPIETA